MMRPRARFHADQTRRQLGDQGQQRVALDRRFDQNGFACGINPVDRKNVLGQIQADGNNGHGLPLPNEHLMDGSHFPSWPFKAGRRNNPRLVRDGEVPFIR